MPAERRLDTRLFQQPSTDEIDHGFGEYIWGYHELARKSQADLKSVSGAFFSGLLKLEDAVRITRQMKESNAAVRPLLIIKVCRESRFS